MKIEIVFFQFSIFSYNWHTQKCHFPFQFIIGAPKVPFSFHFKSEMEKRSRWHFCAFQFLFQNLKLNNEIFSSIFNYQFCWKIEDWKSIFHVSIVEFNWWIRQVKKSSLAFFNLVSWNDVEFLKQKEKILFQLT